MFVRSFVRSFVSSFPPSFLCSFVLLFVCTFVISLFVRSCLRLFVRFSFVSSFPRLFVRSFVYLFASYVELAYLMILPKGTTADLIDGIRNQEHPSHTESENASSHPLVKFKKKSTPVAEDRLDDVSFPLLMAVKYI